jgi:glycosyltransferase involved in cell wall biosynthesis
VGRLCILADNEIHAMNILHSTDQHDRAKYGIAFAVNEIIAQTSPLLSPHGAVSLLSAAGADVDVPAGTSHFCSQANAAWSGRWRFVPHYRETCERVIRAQDIAVLHMHGVWTHPTFAANRAALRCGVPTVLTTHGHLMPWALRQPGRLGALRKKLYLKLMNKPLFQTISALHAITPPERDGLHELFPGKRIEVIPNAIDLVQFDRLAPSGPSGPIERYFLFVGRLHPGKGVDVLVDAFMRANISRDWRLIVVGPPEDAEYADRVRRAATSGERGSSIEWRGPVWDPAEKYALMRGAWAVVLPSHSEVISFVNLEASACCTPTITTPHTGLSDWEEGGGVLAEPDVASLRAAIEASTRWSETERDERGRASRGLVEQRYSTSATAPRWVELYSSLC